MPLLIDFYSGAYGPTLRFSTEVAGDLLRFAEICRNMSRGQCDDVELMGSLGLTHSSVAAITLAVDDRIDRFEGRIVVEQKDNCVAMQWIESLAGWGVATERLMELSRARMPSHQYLAEDRDSDALIEVSYFE